MSMLLPDELWRRIMEIGIETKTLDYKSICCISVTCRRLRGLAGEDCVWSGLLLSDFPRNDLNLIINNDPQFNVAIGNNSPNFDSNLNAQFKSLFKIRYEKEISHKRFVLRLESEIDEHLRQVQERVMQSSREKVKMNKSLAELQNLRKAR